MKRALLVIPALILVGASVNFAVSAVVGILRDPAGLRCVDSGWIGPQPHLEGYWFEFRSRCSRVIVRTRFDRPPNVRASRIDDEHGWPWPSLRAGYTDLEQPIWRAHTALSFRSTPRRDWTGPTDRNWPTSGWGAPPAVALRPVWPGFMYDTLVFAGSLALLWMAWSGSRCVVRMRHGRCLACGYPHGASVVCTECGRPARRRRSRHRQRSPEGEP